MSGVENSRWGLKRDNYQVSDSLAIWLSGEGGK